MSEPPLSQQIKEAEAAIAEAERKLGPDHPDLAEKLQKYALLLRKTEKRTLDAVNVEARAKAIRAKMYAEEERQHGATTITVVKPVERPSSVGMFLGIAGIFCALGSLFVNQEFLILLLPLAVVLGVADVVISRAGFWRAIMIVVFAISAWCANQSLPANMLVDAAPIDRYNYASEHPEVVSDARTLGKPVKVLNFSICLPEGYSGPNDTPVDWGRAMVWQAVPRADSSAPQMMLLIVKLPEELAKKRGNFSILKVARDVAMPHVLEQFSVSDADQELPQLEEINGFQFAHITYKTKTQPTANGFAYVAANNRNLIVLAAQDQAVYSQQTLPPLQASVYTFRQQSR